MRCSRPQAALSHKLLLRIVTKGNTACGPTPHPALRATFPSKGKAMLRAFIACSGRGMPRPYKASIHV